MVEFSQQSNLPAQITGQGNSLRDIVFILFRRRWIVLLVSLPIILVGGASLFRQTSSYSASCRVLVELAKVDLPRWNTAGSHINYDRELSTMFNIAMSLPVAEMAATALEDSLPRIVESLPHRMHLSSTNGLRDFLLEKLDVSAVGESNILEFRFSSASLDVSLMAVGALRDAFVQYQVYGRKNVKAIVYYDEQLQTVQGQMDSLLTLRSEILSDTGYFSIVDQMRNEVGKLADVEGRLLNATANRRDLEQEYRSLKSYLDGDPLAFPMGVNESKTYTLVYWRDMVSKHQDELNSILTIHTEDSIPARRHRSLVEKSLERLRREEIAYVESVRLKFLATQSREQTLVEQVADLKLENARGPQAAARISMVDLEVESLRSLLKDIQGKVGEVRLTQLADERVSSVTALSDPEEIFVLSGGKTVVYFIVIVVFAVAFGIMLALILESMDHRVYHPRDVEDKLKLPVFASVTRTE